MKTLCVYFTRTGLTKQIAGEIASATGADMLCITDGKDRSGFFGYIAAAVVGLRKNLPDLLAYTPALPMDEYDRVVVAAPIWCENVCPMARKFLQENSFRGEVAYVITHMSPLPYDKPIAKLANYAGKQPLAVLSVQTKNYDWTQDVRSFVEKIQ